MKRRFLLIASCLLLVAAVSSAQHLSVTLHEGPFPGYTTFLGDNTHQGQNTAETTLTTANVTAAHFEKAWTFGSADGQIYTQPLVLQSVGIGGSLHNVVYFATMNDTAYALDADTGALLWSASLRAGEAAATATDVASCDDITGKVGVTSTPVIDPISGIIYFTAKTEVSGPAFKYRLHALDIHTGAERNGGPVLMTASVAGTGAGSVGGNISFDPHHNLQRSSLVLLNGKIYMTSASHCDDTPYHGWILEYDAMTLALVNAWANAPNGTTGEGGLWSSGAGPAVDASGNLFVVTGNGDYAPGSGAYSESVIRFSQSLVVQDFFTPHDQPNMDLNDQDMGASDLLLLPDQAGAVAHEIIAGGKQPNIWVVNRDNLGGQSASANDPQIPQFISGGLPATSGGMFGAPVYWNGHVYFCPAGAPEGSANQPCQVRNISSGSLSSVQSSTAATFAYPGGDPVISANGTSNAILWVYAFDTHPHLYAYDATNLGTLLWDSEANSARDSCGMNPMKFQHPTVFNGKVYIAGDAGVCAYANF